MAALAARDEGITSLRLRHPREDRELEVRIETGKYKQVDAVFISVDAVDRILIPFYQGTDSRIAEELRNQVQEQRLEDACVVLHKLSCRFGVPAIDWSATSPIIL